MTLGIIIVLIVAALLIINLVSAESQAKRAAEDYMDKVKNGDEKAEELLGIGVDGFIDMFDYEYLQTMEVPKQKDTTIGKRDRWESLYGDEPDPTYPSFEAYRKSHKDVMEVTGEDYEVLQDSRDVFEYWDKKSYKEIHKVLYDVEIANALGQKIYKKAEITVEPGQVWDGEEFKTGYVITDIYMR